MPEQQSYGATTQAPQQLSTSNSSSRRKSMNRSSSVPPVEPKVYLAGERTFLSWLRLSLVISTFSVALYNGVGETNNSGRLVAFLYALISLMTIVYAYVSYQSRLKKIQNKEMCHYDELYGPIVVCVALFAAVLLNFVLRVKNRDESIRPPKSPWLMNVVSAIAPQRVFSAPS